MKTKRRKEKKKKSNQILHQQDSTGSILLTPELTGLGIAAPIGKHSAMPALHCGPRLWYSFIMPTDFSLRALISDVIRHGNFFCCIGS